MKLRLSLKGGAGAPPTRGAEPTPLAPVPGCPEWMGKAPGQESAELVRIKRETWILGAENMESVVSYMSHVFPSYVSSRTSCITQLLAGS